MVTPAARTGTMSVRSRGRDDALDVTDQVDALVRGTGIQDGLCQIYVAHTTAAVLINENSDPAVSADLFRTLDRLIPWDGRYGHAEGNAAAHIKATLVGTSQTVPIRHGRLALGRWQAIFLAEFDGPRERQLIITAVGS